MGRMSVDSMDTLVVCLRFEPLNYDLKTFRELSISLRSLNLPEKYLMMSMGHNTMGHNFF